MENLDLIQTNNGNDQFIDDLLDFPNDDNMVVTEDVAAFTATDTVDTSCNSSFSAPAKPYFQGAGTGGPRVFADGPISNDLCVPYDELAELEWLSTIVDDTFVNEDTHKLQLIDGMKAQTNEASETHQYQFQPEIASPGPMLRSEMSVPAKARSKRSRAAPGNWTSRLLAVSPTPTSELPTMTSSSSESNISVVGKKSAKPVVQRKKEVPDNAGGGEGRKCLHCATDKTPQWRTGPLGPKTLCNACGVRYKSGRLVPEYRPASSPTFVLTKHSNSHRKVMELRRQKEMMRSHQQQQFLHHPNMMFDGDDYLIHQHIGPDYRQLI
ncbi:hypothetical protein ACS0TY_012421 [Phlomoides rotata]